MNRMVAAAVGVGLGALVWKPREVQGLPGGFSALQRWEAPPWSVFREATYCAESQVLWIRFRSGHEYTYYHVLPRTFAAFLRAREKAAFFNREIRKNHRFHRVDDRFVRQSAEEGGPPERGRSRDDSTVENCLDLNSDFPIEHVGKR